MRRQFWVASLALLSACTKTGTIEGDAYLTMQNGDVRRLAGTTVRWTSDDSAVAADKQISAVCTASARAQSMFLDSNTVLAARASKLDILSAKHDSVFNHSIAMLDSAMFRQAVASDAADSIRTAYARRRVATDVNGHFRLDSLPLGPGRIEATAAFGDNRYSWIVPDTVVTGARKRDLSNLNVLKGAGCQVLGRHA